MICLVCHKDLEEYELEPGLMVHHCSECGGSWMRLQNYTQWQKDNSVQAEKEQEENEHHSVVNSTNAKLCPDCGRILTVYKAANNLNFKIEHCAGCDGIWFDKYEWEVLKKHHLHTKVTSFFTDYWQRKLKDEERKQSFENFYIKKFGIEDYEKVKEIWTWLNNNDNKSMLLAFLMNENPYKL